MSNRKSRAEKRANGRERSRRRYERQRDGVIIVPLPIRHVEVAEYLIKRGLLLPEQYDDREAIGRALSQHFYALEKSDDDPR